MKYLNINQTILQTDDRYTFIDYRMNNNKYDFCKSYYGFDDIYEYDFMNIFKKYMNDDIRIYWTK